MSSVQDRETAYRVAKVRREARARAAAIGRAPIRGLGIAGLPSFADREAAYAKLHPHLMAHKHSGLCPHSDDVPRKRIVLPNGLVLFTTCYKVAEQNRLLKTDIGCLTPPLITAMECNGVCGHRACGAAAA